MSAPRLRETLQIVDGPLTIDCSRLDFIDVTGLGVVVEASQDHDGVTLRNAWPSLRKLIEITGVESVLCVDGTDH